MTMYSYHAVDSRGKGTRGTLQAADQTEALKLIKEMGFFPVKVTTEAPRLGHGARAQRHANRLSLKSRAATTVAPKKCGRVKARELAVFTRQLATLLDAGMPLLRCLRLLQEQESDTNFKRVIGGLAESIESGGSFSEALAQFPKAFDKLYVNMVKAGEISGALELCLKRLAQFMEKSGRIKGRVKTAMVYPAIVVTVATGVMAFMLLFIVPRFQAVFADLYEGRPLPAFTRFVVGVSDALKHNFLWLAFGAVVLAVLFRLAIGTKAGRRVFDRIKLNLPVLGKVFRKFSIARFTRTLGTLVASGVPILQALKIVKEASGNVVIAGVVEQVHANVEQGDSIVGPLRNSRLFPAITIGMVDVGEQSGALPDMLNKIADTYDEEVDNAVAGMMSLLEPVLIIVLGIIVGAIVIAMALPIFVPPDLVSDNGVNL